MYESIASRASRDRQARHASMVWALMNSMTWSHIIIAVGRTAVGWIAIIVITIIAVVKTNIVVC